MCSEWRQQLINKYSNPFYSLFQFNYLWFCLGEKSFKHIHKCDYKFTRTYFIKYRKTKWFKCLNMFNETTIAVWVHLIMTLVQKQVNSLWFWVLFSYSLVCVNYFVPKIWLTEFFLDSQSQKIRHKKIILAIKNNNNTIRRKMFTWDEEINMNVFVCVCECISICMYTCICMCILHKKKYQFKHFSHLKVDDVCLPFAAFYSFSFMMAFMCYFPFLFFSFLQRLRICGML